MPAPLQTPAKCCKQCGVVRDEAGKLVVLPLLLSLTKSRMNVKLIVVGLALRAAELMLLAR